SSFSALRGASWPEVLSPTFMISEKRTILYIALHDFERVGLFAPETYLTPGCLPTSNFPG
ncbi:MAG: hypothetical protein KKE57_12100, partial [Proteobacteria bacterium]|nr:hypothetical protein [Pseudomonadota bacterium]